MSNEQQMTNEQKAVIIAKWNGNKLTYPNLAFIHTKDGAIVPPINIAHIAKQYLTDLNYLVPVAVKVRSAINNYDANKPLADIFMRLCYQMATYDKTPEGTYQPLFDAVHSAIMYLQNVDKIKQ